MPVGAKEDETSSHIYDQVAKESSDSTASDHPIHEKATAQDHQSKGPQIVEKMPEAKGKEELQAEAKKMNE